jgi:spore coat protein U-like protein
VAFGAYDPFAAGDMSAVGRVTVTCDKNNVLFTVALSSGGPGGFFPRRMSSGADTLDYNLYTAPGGSIVFGDGTPGTQMMSATTTPVGGGDFAANVWIYGRLPAGQNAAVGSYSATVFVTIYY